MKHIDNIDHTNNSNKGWECPRCGKVNAPSVLQCECVKQNVSGNTYIPRAVDGREILNEVV